MPKKIIYYPVTVEFEGKEFSATYCLESNVVTVHSIYGSSSTIVGGSHDLFISRTLFLEILTSAKPGELLK